ncbi:MAG: hypothetical protein PHZ00_01605 [Candidatus Peribacteraceae bacterium]|nr:hypothetical protein [Candidatus Peribacteraceae bacterium]
MTSAGTIAVYFTKPKHDDAPLNREEFVCSYHEFGRQVAAQGGTLALVRSMASFRGGNRFQSGWIFDGTTFVRSEELMEGGVVYNKGEDFIGDAETALVNDPELHALCDKDRTYRLFPEFCPLSVIVQSAQELKDALCSLPADRVICKPTTSCGGEGIMIGTKSEISSREHRYPLIIQEFMDLSGGIPGVVDGLHDLRLVFIGDRFSYAMIRTPKPGGLMANICQGGSFFTVPDAAIPKEAMEIALAIDRRLQSFKTRVYSVDLGLNADGRWRVLELNSPPGLIPSRGDAIMDRDHRILAEHLLSVANERSRTQKNSIMSRSCDAASQRAV